jgi:hypothetical protein
VRIGVEILGQRFRLGLLLRQLVALASDGQTAALEDWGEIGGNLTGEI